MQIQRRSITEPNKVNTMEIDITEAQMVEWQQGALIQNAMPNISDDEREFILTGLLPDEWEALFGE